MILLKILVVVLSLSVLLHILRILFVTSPLTLRSVVPAATWVSGVCAAGVGVVLVGGAVAGGLTEASNPVSQKASVQDVRSVVGTSYVELRHNIVPVDSAYGFRRDLREF